eukprot:852734-Pelagomonas_calceolata.AAC.5
MLATAKTFVKTSCTPKWQYQGMFYRHVTIMTTNRDPILEANPKRAEMSDRPGEAPGIFPLAPVAPGSAVLACKAPNLRPGPLKDSCLACWKVCCTQTPTPTAAASKGALGQGLGPAWCMIDWHYIQPATLLTIDG